MTAKHVIDRQGDLSVEQGGKKYTASLHCKASDQDLAHLVVGDWSKLNHTSIYEGERPPQHVHSWGASSGSVSGSWGRRRGDDNEWRIRMRPGDSGAGIFADGKLVGVVHGGPRPGGPITYSSTRKGLLSFLSRCRRRPPTEPTPGPEGEKGPRGDKGPTGDKGPIGDKGPSGDSAELAELKTLIEKLIAENKRLTERIATLEKKEISQRFSEDGTALTAPKRVRLVDLNPAEPSGRFHINFPSKTTGGK